METSSFVPPIDPLIVTLRMDHAAQDRFTALRQQHFPPERNFLNAHITLFHKLPGAEIETVLAAASDVAKTTPRFELRTDGLLFFGGGVAYRLHATDAVALRQQLVKRWADLLSPQDANKIFVPHITVQNKVKGDVAKQLHAQLQRTFKPENVTAVGIEVWHYRGGPWEPAGRFNFPVNTDA